MVRRTITIELESGLEARPVAMLVQVASQYDSSIYVECDSRRVNAKSIMGMMTLGLTAGEQVVVTAEGTDEEMPWTELQIFDRRLTASVFLNIEFKIRCKACWDAKGFAPF